MDLGDAIAAVKAGKVMTRTGDHEFGSIWLSACVDVVGLPTAEPMILASTADGVVPWRAKQTDMLATDWCEAA